MPGAVSEGDTRDEALRNIVEAMTGWWEVAIEEGFGPREATLALIDEEIAFVLGWKAEEGYELLIETATVHVDTLTTVAASPVGRLAGVSGRQAMRVAESNRANLPRLGTPAALTECPVTFR
jgi:hypothetical protein